LYSYDAFGNALGFDPSTALTEFLYSGEQFDSKINQQYLRQRYYDPSTGRFNRLDPFFGNLNDPLSLHKYAYANGDPIGMIDPSGLFGVAGVGISMSISSGMRASLSMASASFSFFAIRTFNLMFHLVHLIVAVDILSQIQRVGRPPTTAAEFLSDWVHGCGQQNVFFDNSTHFVQDMKNHSHVRSYREYAINQASQRVFGEVVDKWHSYAGFDGIPVAIRDALGINGAWESVPIVGSYNLKIKTSRNIQNNSVVLEYTIENTMGLESATRIPVLGYLNQNHWLINDWGLPQYLLNDTNEGPFRNKTMHLYWQEEVPLILIGN
jgi:RHS repeat-associated protein